MLCVSALVEALSHSRWRGAPAGGGAASAGGLERLQRAPAVPAAEESGADHPDVLEESPADASLGRAPHTGHLEEPQTETQIPAAAPRRRHAPGRLQGAARAPQVSTLTPGPFRDCTWTRTQTWIHVCLWLLNGLIYDNGLIKLIYERDVSHGCGMRWRVIFFRFEIYLFTLKIYVFFMILFFLWDFQLKNIILYSFF